MSDVKQDHATALTDADIDIEHVVCCLDLKGEGPALCGTDVTTAEWAESETPIDECVVCSDLARSDYCPDGNTCPKWGAA